MKLKMTLFCPHGQTHGRVSRPCLTYGLAETRACVSVVCATRPRTRVYVLAV
ncbi:Glypican-5 [Gossypium arboreum]|uniref:Glypican-5 n=1 Tax=Gossypium arboreum TaxID=29729 RepID=A0A0B0N3B3_GOSAR|nr:Glypican-5 [Gossypium arboreum]